MKCREIKKIMFSYLDGELVAAEQELFLRHLQECPACTKLLAEYKQTWQLLGSWENIEPQPGYYERLKARLAERKTWQETLFENLRSMLLPKPVFQTVLALGIFVIFFFSGQSYINYQTTQSLLSNMSEQEWEMLANYETVSKMDLVKPANRGKML